MTKFLERYDRKWIVFWAVSIISLVLDQASKIWARSSLPVNLPQCIGPEFNAADWISHPPKCYGQSVTVIDGFWDWHLSMNPGSAFGLFGGFGPSFTRVFLSLIGIGAVVGMVYMLRKSRPDQRILHWALALVAGGAVGNLIDRIYSSVVTDFVSWHYKGHVWPTFNIADVVLVVGVGLMFIDIQKENNREKGKRKARQAKAKAEGLVKD